jgi:hypothetical protein
MDLLKETAYLATPFGVKVATGRCDVTDEAQVKVSWTLIDTVKPASVSCPWDPLRTFPLWPRQAQYRRCLR